MEEKIFFRSKFSIAINQLGLTIVSIAFVVNVILVFMYTDIHRILFLIVNVFLVLAFNRIAKWTKQNPAAVVKDRVLYIYQNAFINSPPIMLTQINKVSPDASCKNVKFVADNKMYYIRLRQFQKPLEFLKLLAQQNNSVI